jgi:hypothetical protein
MNDSQSQSILGLTISYSPWEFVHDDCERDCDDEHEDRNASWFMA